MTSRALARIVSFGVLLGLFLVPPLVAQEASDQALREKIEALEAGQAEIQRQLAEIKRLLQVRAAPAAPPAPNVNGVEFELGENEILGVSSAPLTLVEFTDYQCPYCGRHVRDTYPQLARAYIDTGGLRYATLDMPLESIHPLAFKASEAVHCAREQGAFWPMHDRLFAHQQSLEPWSGHAEALGLDVEAFDQCLEEGRMAEIVRSNMALARRVGANGTPVFLLARTDPDDPTRVSGLSTLRGAQPFTTFEAAIDAALLVLQARGEAESD